MAAKKILDHARLREHIQYHPETGEWSWLIRVGGRRPKPGQNGPTGYLAIHIFGQRYLAHRLAWFYMTGYWPAEDIDHINGIRTDNRWCNLRECTRQQNTWNRPLNHNNKSGFHGVHKRGKRWSAQISLGSFDTPEEAHEAFRAVALTLRGKFVHPNLTEPQPRKGKL